MPNPLFDRAALGAVFAEHRPRLEAIIRRRVGGRPDRTDDILQDALLTATRRWPEYQAAGRPVPEFVWLYGFVRDRITDAHRRAGRAGRVQPLPADTTFQLGLNLVAPSATPSRAVARDELVRLVRGAIAALPDADREVITMHAVDGLTFAQIGAAVGQKENTMNVRYVRAVRKLRAALEALGGGTTP